MTSPTELIETPALDAAWAESLLQPDRPLGPDDLPLEAEGYQLADDEVEEDDDDDDEDDDEESDDEFDDEDEEEEETDDGEEPLKL
jgi:hypothetical protein